MYIYNEIPVWLVNWVNTIFTLANDIGSIEEVYLGGAAYRDFTFLDNVITLADAPLTGMVIGVDYFTDELDVPIVDTTVTLGDIIEETYDAIGVTRNSNVHLERALKRHVIKGLEKIRNNKYYKDVVLQYSFNKHKELEAWDYSAIGVDIKVQDYIPSTGYFFIKDSAIASYSSYTTWVLSSSPWFIYDKWDRVSIGYRIPDGIKKISEVVINGNIIQYKDIREYRLQNENYTVYRTQSGIEYLFLPITSDPALVTVRYIPEYSIESEDETLINIEYEYTPVISEYAAYKMLLDREDDRWQAKKKEYQESLKEYLSYKAKAVNDTNNKFNSGILSNF